MPSLVYSKSILKPCSYSQLDTECMLRDIEYVHILSTLGQVGVEWLNILRTLNQCRSLMCSYFKCLQPIYISNVLIFKVPLAHGVYVKVVDIF